jgi:anthranilate synthase
MRLVATEQDEIEYSNPFEFYKRYSGKGDVPSFLLESRTKNLAYGRESIVVPSAAVMISGKNDRFRLKALNETGDAILSYFSADDFSYATELNMVDDEISGRVEQKTVRNLDVIESLRQPNSGYVIRTVLDKFKVLHDEHLGLYGAFAYNYARNYIDYGTRFCDDPGCDFSFFLPTTVVFFDDIRERARIKRIFFDNKNDGLAEILNNNGFSPAASRQTEDMSIFDYQEKVAELVKQIRQGRMMQCVLSRNQGFSLEQPPIESYGRLRELNPSPYSFYFSLGDGEYLYGASPELHIKIVNGEIEIRPIAGTVKRSPNPREDARARIGLLTDMKERREHSMLVDLATSELCRLSKQGSVRITDLFTLESYPNLYHIVSGVRGNLRDSVDALDALLTTIPAGTLSGAPKAEAMKAIDQMESSRRNFYGGAVGYIGFNGDCNTGITIRSIHVKDEMSYMRAGAGIVAHSVPESEAREIALKSNLAVEVLRK